MEKGEVFWVGNYQLLGPLKGHELTITMPSGKEVRAKITGVGPEVSQVTVIEEVK
jgi:hypothetical protein